MELPHYYVWNLFGVDPEKQFKQYWTKPCRIACSGCGKVTWLICDHDTRWQMRYLHGHFYRDSGISCCWPHSGRHDLHYLITCNTLLPWRIWSRLFTVYLNYYIMHCCVVVNDLVAYRYQTKIFIHLNCSHYDGFCLLIASMTSQNHIFLSLLFFI